TTTVAVGSYPQAVAVNSVTNQIYVTNLNSSNVTVIDGATNNTTTVAVGNGPDTVGVNTNTNQIYVANLGSGNVTVITP
ncbi:MAG: YncE family protein, partial [Candidatus Sulfotelmatobacter sp.]